MIHFFYKRAKTGGKRSVRRAVFFAIVTIILIAIPFVDGIIWFLLNVVGLGLDPFSIYALIGPTATTLAVLAIIAPVAAVWFQLFRRIDEEALAAQRAQSKAEELLAQRTDFVAYVSHEIRNPLNGIIGIADTMESENLDEANRQNVEIIRSSARDLMFILNDILDISKIDEGKVELNPTEVSMQNELKQILNFWQPRAKAEGLDLSLTVCETFPNWVILDNQRFRQIVNNLVSNAIKYTDRGSIVISADCDYVNQRAQISVHDTGLGVPPDLQASIFAPYQQVPDSSSGERKLGTGLGLPIARRLARLMGGDVVLAESSRAGSRFIFSFEVQPIDIPQDQVMTRPQLMRLVKDRSALVVDDSLTGALVAREHLKRLGLQAEVVTTGRAAIEKLGNRRYDYVLLDDDLGDMRGKTVMDQYPEKSIYFAYTGRATKDEIRQFKDGGFQGFIAKPALYDNVEQEFMRVLARSTSLSEMQK